MIIIINYLCRKISKNYLFLQPKFFIVIYPSDFKNKIGFRAVREKLNDLCISEMGKERVGKMKFMTDIDEIETWLKLIEDFEVLLRDGIPFPVRDYNDLREEFKHLSIDGTVISLENIFALKPTLSALYYVFKFSTRNHPIKCRI